MSIQRWGMSTRMDGEWVRYADHVAAVEGRWEGGWKAGWEHGAEQAREQAIKDCFILAVNNSGNGVAGIIAALRSLLHEGDEA